MLRDARVTVGRFDPLLVARDGPDLDAAEISTVERPVSGWAMASALPADLPARQGATDSNSVWEQQASQERLDERPQQALHPQAPEKFPGAQQRERGQAAGRQHSTTVAAAPEEPVDAPAA